MYKERNKLNKYLYFFLRDLWRLITGYIYWDNYFSGKNICIGKSVAIGPGVKIISTNHNVYNIWEHAQPESPIIIEDYCWIGANSVVLPQVHLGKHTIVGAGSIVTKSFPEGYCVIAGNPARKIKDLDKNKCKEV
jgi:acetyltransferase-like isoleucine patch superfamily enzyme